MSGIFSHATSLGLLDRNPIRDVKVLARVRPPKPRVKYTPEETAAVLNALTEPDAKLFFALCGVLAMRPEETAAVRWENIDLKAGVLKVREAAPYGKLGELKTEQSQRDLHFGEDVRGFIEAWHNVMGKPTTGFLFTFNGADPVNSNSFSRDRITAQAKKACARWCGLYSGRHGAATTLYHQDGDVRAAYQNLGNSLEVVIATYIEPDTATGRVSSLKMQDALGKELKKEGVTK
jgi:integrase